MLDVRMLRNFLAIFDFFFVCVLYVVKKEPVKLDRRKIAFKKVSSSYQEDKNTLVLDNLSFATKPGSAMTLVKAIILILISLLERYYDHEWYDVRIDGSLIHNYDINFLRYQLSLLLNTNTKENIRAGNHNVTDEMTCKVAKQRDAHEFIPKLYLLNIDFNVFNNVFELRYDGDALISPAIDAVGAIPHTPAALNSIPTGVGFFKQVCLVI